MTPVDVWIQRPYVLVRSDFTGEARLRFSHAGAPVSNSALMLLAGQDRKVPLNPTEFGQWTVCATTLRRRRSAQAKYVGTTRTIRDPPSIEVQQEVVLRASPPLLGRRAQVQFVGETIQGRSLKKNRTLALHPRTILRYPRWPLNASVSLKVTTDPFTVAGVQWPRGWWLRSIR